MNPVQEKLAKRDTWTRSESLKYLALAICLLAMAVISTMSLNAQCPGGAGNDNWTRPGGGDWSNGGNWSLGVPYQRFNACIPARTGVVSVKPTNVGTGIFAAKNLTILSGTTKLNLVRPDRGNKKVELDLYGQTLTNQGGIQFLNAQGSTLSFKATNSDLSITGGGSLYLESPPSSVDVGDGDVLTTDNTIFGRGNFGSPRAVLKNNGEFEADISGATLQIYAGQRKGQKDPWGLENDGAIITFGGSALKVSVSGSAVSVGNIIANGPDAQMLLATGPPDDYFRNAGDISVRNGAPKKPSTLTILTQKFDNNGSLDIGPFGTATIIGTFGSLATNSGIMNIAADGTLTFQTDGFQQTAGTTTVNGLLAIAHGAFLGGTLMGSGTVKGNIISTGATVKPGNSPGILTINGTYTQQGEGNYLVDIAGTAPGSGYGQLAVTENASLGGTLSVGLLGGFTPTPGDFFTILTAGDGLGGDFGNAPPVIAPNIGDITADGYNFEVIYNWSGTGPGSIVLANFTPVPVPEPASLLLFGSGVLALRKVVRERR